MTRHNQYFKSLVLSKSHLLSKYFVLAGLCLSLMPLHNSLAFAQQPSGFDYGLAAVEAIQFFNLPDFFTTKVENGLILDNYNFILAVCPINSPDNKNIKAGASAPQAPRTIAENIKRVTVTAYSSTPDQTDSTPFITANGKYVYDGIVACNFLPFGTKVKFPEVYGDKIFTVEDRMAWYNSHKIDIWMPDRQSALQFGVKRLAYEIVD